MEKNFPFQSEAVGAHAEMPPRAKKETPGPTAITPSEKPRLELPQKETAPTARENSRSSTPASPNLEPPVARSGTLEGPEVSGKAEKRGRQEKRAMTPLEEKIVSEPIKKHRDLPPLSSDRVISFRYKVEKRGESRELDPQGEEALQARSARSHQEEDLKPGKEVAPVQRQNPAPPRAEPRSESPTRSSLRPGQQALPRPVYTSQKREKAQPRLVIGKLTVEVVQTAPPAVEAVSKPPRHRPAASAASQKSDRPRYKLKYGLGQI